MADIKDVTEAVHSALEEVGVTGELGVTANGETIEKPLGTPTGDDVVVKVAVEPAGK